MRAAISKAEVLFDENLNLKSHLSLTPFHLWREVSSAKKSCRPSRFASVSNTDFPQPGEITPSGRHLRVSAVRVFAGSRGLVRDKRTAAGTPLRSSRSRKEWRDAGGFERWPSIRSNLIRLSGRQNAEQFSMATRNQGEEELLKVTKIASLTW